MNLAGDFPHYRGNRLGILVYFFHFASCAQTESFRRLRKPSLRVTSSQLENAACGKAIRIQLTADAFQNIKYYAGGTYVHSQTKPLKLLSKKKKK